MRLKTQILNGTRLVFRNPLAERMLYAVTKGKKWDDALARLPANYYQYPKGSWRTVERNGFQLRLDISDYMQWLLYFGILAEPRESLYQLVRPGMTVIDVGANIGETTLMFSRLTGENGRVISLEPHPGTFRHLQEHLSVNPCRNVTAVNKGLGKSEGELQLEEGEHNSGGNRIASNGQGKKIIVTTLDQLVEELQLSAVNFIKIDVEGYEHHVLQGAVKTIDKFHPQLFVEVVDDFLRAQGTSAKELVTFLLGHHYKLRNAYNGEPVNAEAAFAGTHFDIIATPA